MAKGIEGLPPGGLDEYGTFPGQGSSAWNLLSGGVTQSTDTADLDYNCHSVEINDAIISPYLGVPLVELEEEAP